MTSRKTKFSWTNYLIRLAAALVLVFATYNPSEWSFFHWIQPATEDFAKAHVFMALAGIALLIRLGYLPARDYAFVGRDWNSTYRCIFWNFDLGGFDLFAESQRKFGSYDLAIPDWIRRRIVGGYLLVPYTQAYDRSDRRRRNGWIEG